MTYHLRGSRIGSSGRLSDHFQAIRQKIETEIQSKPDSYLLQVNEDDYVGHLVEKYSIEPPQLDDSRRSAETVERQIPSEQFPSTWNVRRGKSYPATVVINRIPGFGEVHLLSLQANVYSMSGYPNIIVSSSHIEFEIVAFGENTDRVNQQIGESLRDIYQALKWVQSDIQSFNDSLPHFVRQEVQGRKAVLKQRSSFLDSLNVPIKVRPDTPPVVTVPLTVARSIAPPPKSPSTKLEPNPLLDDATYELIIESIDFFARGIERLPSTYAGKGEEDLRDQLLLGLASRFTSDGTISGETFNHTGKTDILISVGGKNIFAAECKFWKGPKKFLATISQLLEYLTWRDGKAAVLVFDQQEQFSADLETILSTVPLHPNYLKTLNDSDPANLRYQFYLDDDRGLVVTLAVLAMHLPKKGPATLNRKLDAIVAHQINIYRLTESERTLARGSAGSIDSLKDMLPGLAGNSGVEDEMDVFIAFVNEHDLKDQIEFISFVPEAKPRIKAKFKD